MAKALIECIPNLSEGRNHKALDQLWQQLLRVPDLHCLNQHRDEDHHRSVLTLAGSPQAIQQAADHIFAWSQQHIDLKSHSGVHPRIGAVDVFPIVPLAGISHSEALVFTQELAAQITSRWQVPCIFYEKSALPGQTFQLPLIRKQLKKQPKLPPNAQGSCVIGVRNPLIAWNVWLKNNDLSLAKKIAYDLREVNQGFKGLRALGLPLPKQQQVQVSMNLIDHRASRLSAIFKTIKARAQQQNTDVCHTEFIGLVPETALADFVKQTIADPTIRAGVQTKHGLNSVLTQVSGKKFRDFFL